MSFISIQGTTLSILFCLLTSGIFLNYYFKKMRKNNDKKARFNSLPKHYSYCFCLWLVIFLIGILFLDISILLKLIFLSIFIIGNFFLIRFAYLKNFNAKKHFESANIALLALTAIFGIGITIAITIIIFSESLKFFQLVNISDFLFSLSWNPQMAITSEQEVSQSSFGIIPVFTGTLLITLIAMAVAIPIGIISAIYLGMYAKSSTRNILKPLIEILAGVPTVVYGYFAVIAIAPFFKNFFSIFSVNISTESALATGFVMGIMIIPFILSLTDDAISTVPQSLKDGALALGSTKSEMIKKVIIPSAMPSIVGAIILAVSRAIGETMIVVMSAGLVARLTFNPLNSVTTATAQIVTLLVGDQEFNSPKTLSAFALALALFIFTFILNVIALGVIKNYKKKYS
jgi:phosphate transport system permease protein